MGRVKDFKRGEGGKRVRRRGGGKGGGGGRERGKTNKTRGDYASAIWEERYVSEPIETKCFKL